MNYCTMINLNLNVSQIKESDDQIKTILNITTPFKTISINLDNFKTYDELKEKLNRTITGALNATTI